MIRCYIESSASEVEELQRKNRGHVALFQMVIEYKMRVLAEKIHEMIVDRLEKEGP